MKMNKCIILCICCNKPCYIRQRLLITETWGKPILEGKYENLDLWFYTSSDHNYIDIDNHIIYVNTDDNIFNTFEKTRLTYEILNNYFNYDFIFRTNCSTVINCQLLSAFINTLDKQTNIFWSWGLCDYIYEKTYTRLFDFYHFYGFSLLMSHNIIDEIFEALQYSEIIYDNNIQLLRIFNHENTKSDIIKYDANDMFMKAADDTIIGYLFFQYHKYHNTDALKYCKRFPAYFYKVFEKNTVFWDNLDLGYDKADINYYKDCLCVRVKNEYKSDDIIMQHQLTEQSIYEISKMYKTKLSDDVIQNAINNIYKICNDNKNTLYIYI